MSAGVAYCWVGKLIIILNSWGGGYTPKSGGGRGDGVRQGDCTVEAGERERSIPNPSRQRKLENLARATLVR